MAPIRLPNATEGKVITRFPPEPSWVLDLGHCKASLTNQHIATQFKGQWILRFDDTNPKTCSKANVDAYLQDMPLLGLQPDRVTFASDYFEAMIDTATALISTGFLYADDTPTEEMRAQRMAKQASPRRDQRIQDSLSAWSEMQKAGSEAGRGFCLRFKLNPGSENGALRDPVAWRGVDEPHYKTGTQFRVYPTYDFAAPFLDLAEGVTHALRTLEFRDRDCLYNAVQQAILKLHPEWVSSNIWEFPRIHMSYTPQAKVHQKALLAAGLVEGPTDPRLPTLRGLMRAGCHPDALKAFLLEQVSPARKETCHSWDKLWTLNRRLLDPTAARHMAVADEGRVLLTVLDGPTEPREVEVVWKQGHVVKVVPYRQVWIDQEDAQLLSEGDELTLLAWGNVTIQSVTRIEHQQQQQRQQHQPDVLQHSSIQQQASSAETSARATPDQQQQHDVLHKAEPPDKSPPSPVDSSTSPPAGVPPAAAAAPAPPPLGHQEPAGDANGPMWSAGDAEQAFTTAGASSSSSESAVFTGFKDVMALRDELQRAHKAHFETSSCASTAGSTSVAALASLQSEVDEASSSWRGDKVSRRPPSSPQPAAAPVAAAASCQQQQDERDPAQAAVVSITAVLSPHSSPKASKLKVHWLPNLADQLVPLRLVRFGHPVVVEKVTEDVDVVANFNQNSRSEVRAWGDPSLVVSARKGNVVQLQRKGFFIVDEVVLKPSAGRSGAAAADAVSSGHDAVVVVPTGAEAAAAAAAATQSELDVLPCDVHELVLFFIPDGHTKNEPAATLL